MGPRHEHQPGHWHRHQRVAWVAVVDLTTASVVIAVVLQSGERDDVKTLRQVTAANRETLADHSELPRGTGRTVVHRWETAELLGAEGGFVITGEPGSGKPPRPDGVISWWLSVWTRWEDSSTGLPATCRVCTRSCMIWWTSGD